MAVALLFMTVAPILVGFAVEDSARAYYVCQCLLVAGLLFMLRTHSDAVRRVCWYAISVQLLAALYGLVAESGEVPFAEKVVVLIGFGLMAEVLAQTEDRLWRKPHP